MKFSFANLAIFCLSVVLAADCWVNVLSHANICVETPPVRHPTWKAGFIHVCKFACVHAANQAVKVGRVVM